MYTRWLRSACQSHGHLRGDRARLKGTLGVAHNSVNGDQSHGIMTISPATWYHPWRQTVVDKLEPPQSRTRQCYPDLKSETSWVRNVRRGLLPTPNPLQVSVTPPGTLLFHHCAPSVYSKTGTVESERGPFWYRAEFSSPEKGHVGQSLGSSPESGTISPGFLEHSLASFCSHAKLLFFVGGVCVEWLVIFHFQTFSQGQTKV